MCPKWLKKDYILIWIKWHPRLSQSVTLSSFLCSHSLCLITGFSCSHNRPSSFYALNIHLSGPSNLVFSSSSSPRHGSRPRRFKTSHSSQSPPAFLAYLSISSLSLPIDRSIDFSSRADSMTSDEEEYYSSDQDALDGIENDDEDNRNWPSSSLPSCQVRVSISSHPWFELPFWHLVRWFLFSRFFSPFHLIWTWKLVSFSWSSKAGSFTSRVFSSPFSLLYCLWLNWIEWGFRLFWIVDTLDVWE